VPGAAFTTHHMPFTASLALAAALALGAAEPLAELQATLTRLTATTPVTARFSHHFEQRNGEGKDASLVQGEVAGEVSESSAGLELRWGPEVLERARQEGRRRAADPEAPSPTQDGIAELDALRLSRSLDVVPELREALGHATLVEDRSEPLDGAPARLLVLKLDPPLRARDRKYVKELDATAKIWLGPDGVPVAAERRVRTGGRAFLVVTFESEERESFRFAHLGDRLVAVRHELDRHGQGAGERSARKSTTTLEVRPAAAPAP
jgi:hypothetical protein